MRIKLETLSNKAKVLHQNDLTTKNNPTIKFNKNEKSKYSNLEKSLDKSRMTKLIKIIMKNPTPTLSNFENILFTDF